MATTLARYMKQTGLSCRRFGQLAGLDFSYVSRLATGDRMPSMDAASKIEKATGGRVPMKSWRKRVPA